MKEVVGMTKVTSRFVGSIPEKYDRHLGPVLFDGYASDLAHRCFSLNPATLLELAAGTGIVTRKLRDLLPRQTTIMATDLNEPMLEIARSKFETNDNVSFQQVDATNLDFDDESFEVVACQFGVMFFPEKSRSYSEVFRVLKPEGAYIFNVWDSWAKNEFAEVTHSAVAKLFPADPPGFYKVPFHYHDTDEIRRELSDAGFRRVDIQHVQLRPSIRSAEDFAEGLVFGNPLSEEIAERGGDPNHIFSEVAAVIRDEIGPTMSLSAWIIEATKTAED